MLRKVLLPSAEHPITIKPTRARVVVTVAGHTVADTTDALSLNEADYPAVQYIPLDDVDQRVLRRTKTSTYCPYKGEAGYYSVVTPEGHVAEDVVWEYREPHDAVKQIAGHVAFYADRAEIAVLEEASG
ncbi:uncharacterized protein (DUF427 family) [Thermocatellispora tengchongensis]|uniref:Uncharacterized protein (DUF427 family) n=1 Tax=Thermocatellispora tengchongensis TaxID=1073253 RepID=A0A840NWX5_9ACTN|nr:DUF427 domain-containing protein [Thermocatellispora tengchongensis]MBB5130696.1 uncharacterized protein (DUF427 family) [Thermocatellispora tengchongensis]